jgi:hypothetical protein
MFLGTTQLPSRRQHSQVARQAAFSIMVNAVFAFNALSRDSLVEPHPKFRDKIVIGRSRTPRPLRLEST